MPQSLAPIPLATEITEKDGTITSFFRLRWQQLIDSFTKTPTVANFETAVQTAAIVTTTAYTAIAAARYRIAVYTQKTIADGVSSSVQITVGWTSKGVPCTHTFTALATDTVGANDSVTWEMNVDASSPITYAAAYGSNTPNRMAYFLDVTVEQLA